MERTGSVDSDMECVATPREDPEELAQLRSTVRMAEAIFWRCRRYAKNPNRDDFAPLALFRHMLEMADGVEVLLSAKCLGAVEPLLRSMFEAFVSLQFIVESDYPRPSRAWCYGNIQQEIRYRQLYDETTEKGAKFKRAIIDRFKIPNEKYELSAKTSKHFVGQLRELLKSFQLDVMDEAEKKPVKRGTKKRGMKKHREWYQVLNIENRYELAQRVGLGPVYELFYPRWSAKVHGTDPNSLLVELADGTVEFGPLRQEADWDVKLAMFDAFLSTSIQLMLDKFVITPAFLEIDPQFSRERVRQDGDRIFYTHSDGRELDVTALFQEDGEPAKD